MKIALTSQGTNLDSLIDPRLGRTKGFIIVNSESMEYQYLENTWSSQSARGAGIQAAQVLADEKVAVLITGNCGPKAFTSLKAAGIKVIAGVQGQIRECIEKWQKGELKPSPSATMNSHWR